MGFVLLQLINANFFIRPAEFLPIIYGQPIALALFVLAFIASFDLIFARFSRPIDPAKPITVCVFAVMAFAVLSHLARFQFGEAYSTFDLTSKIILYYVLMTVLIDSPDRLRQTWKWLGLSIVTITALSVAKYHGFVNIDEIIVTLDGDGRELRRLGAIGIFGDPNDMGLMLALGIPIALYFASEPGHLGGRIFWIPAVGLQLYALHLTHSRGGILALLGSWMAYTIARFGRKAVLVNLVALPLLFALFAGRQTDFRVSTGTAQTRLHLWDVGWQMFRTHPILGTGFGTYLDYSSHVAHNSYIHTYGEIGFFGGTAFLGIFLLGAWYLYRMRPDRTRIEDAQLRRMYPFLVMMLAALAVGLMSLSHTYTIPAYSVPAMVAAYLRMAETDPPLPAREFDGRLARRLALAGIGFLMALRIFLLGNLSYL